MVPSITDPRSPAAGRLRLVQVLPNAARTVALADVDGDGRAEVVIQIDAHGSGGNDFWVMKFVPPAFTPGFWEHLSPIPGHPPSQRPNYFRPVQELQGIR